jgi:signal peptidase II
MGVFIVLLIVAADQLSKFAALRYLRVIGDYPLIQGLFHLTYVENRGAAFGLFQNQKAFFIIITTIVVAAIIYYLSTTKKVMLPLRLGLYLIIGGAVGNLIDRIRLGFVVDFFHLVDLWPVFNIADSAVVVGAILVSYIIIRYDSVTR